MSSATDNAFQDSDVRLLQQMMARIERLEEQAVGLTPGMLFPFAGPVRSAKFSESHLEAIAEKWSHHYQLNEINEEGIAEDRTGLEAFQGLLKADSVAALPLQGQPGGLASDGSYSYYFPGKEHSRVQLPLLSALTTEFSFEVLFKPETLPQKSIIFYNGTYLTNGWGVAIGNATFTAEGKNLLLVHSSGAVVNTGVEVVEGQWAWFGVTWESSTSMHYSYGLSNSITKVITANGTIITPTVVKPTGTAFIGSPSATALPFKGWVDEVVVYNGNINVTTEAKESVQDRRITALEPSAPPGFVFPDGTAVSRAKFDRLFKTIGTIFGAGDGTTTFNLPNLTNKVLIGREAEALGATLSKQFGTAGTAFSLLNTNYLIKI